MSLFRLSTERRAKYVEGCILSDRRCGRRIVGAAGSNAYIGNYLSIYGGMDTQSYVLLMQSEVTGFQILGGVLLGLFGAAYLFRRKP